MEILIKNINIKRNWIGNLNWCFMIFFFYVKLYLCFFCQSPSFYLINLGSDGPNCEQNSGWLLLKLLKIVE